VHLVVFIAYILIVSATDCSIHCIHIFSSSAASLIIKFSVLVFSEQLQETWSSDVGKCDIRPISTQQYHTCSLYQT